MADKRDFFISFTSADTEIATALNDALRAAQFTTWFHPVDKPLGAGIADWMELALDETTQMIAVCSNAYFDREKGYSRAERQSMFWEDPTNQQPLLILVKVEDCKLPRLIAQNEFIDLTGLMAEDAAAKLVGALRGEKARQERERAAQIAADFRRPAIFNLKGVVNPHFAGRDIEMAMLHKRLRRAGVTAITGMGGLGKSTLAREYALRHGVATRFGGVWWVPAETESGIIAAFEALAKDADTDIEEGENQRDTAVNALTWLGERPAAFPVLVIFDNAPDDETVAEWLPGGNTRVLITSRYRHFDNAEPMPLQLWDLDITTRFLLERSGRGTEAAAQSLADRLGGLPLAAEQAGAYLNARPDYSFARYEAKLVERLNDPPKKLPGGYPRPIAATFEAALDAVLERDEGEAALGILTLCAFLSPDGVDLKLLTDSAEVEGILPDPPQEVLADSDRRSDALLTLTAYALMRWGEPNEWGEVLLLHRLVAEIAKARLDEDEHEIWSGAAVQMTKRLMPSGPNGGKGHPSADTSVWPLCARLVPHARALQGLDPGPGPVGEALGYLLNQAALYLAARGDGDGATDLSRQRVALNDTVYRDSPELQAIALGNLANRLRGREENWNEAEAAYARALEIKEAVLAPDDPLIANTLSNMGWIP